MEEPVYLLFADLLEIYAAIIGGTAEQAADHLRSRHALEGALARPATHAQHGQADLALQAAVLAHGIAETQPFIDGNKCAALVAMLTFLEINGYRVRATDPELAEWIISLSRRITPDEASSESSLALTASHSLSVSAPSALSRAISLSCSTSPPLKGRRLDHGFLAPRPPVDELR